MLDLLIVALGLISLGHVITAATPVVTGTYKPPLFPGQCDISLKAWGYVDTEASKGSYIRVNGLTYLDPSNDINPATAQYRGFNLVTLDTKTCKASNFGHFDTNLLPADSDLLAKYIYDLPAGTHILGVTSDWATLQLQLSAKNALKSVGVDVTGLGQQGKLLFHVVKGQPDKSVVKILPAGGNSLYYEEKAKTCDICQNGGVLKMNAEETGLYCQCPSKKYEGFFCENISEICA